MDLFWRQLASLLGPAGPFAPQQIWLPTPQAGERRILLRAPQALTLSRLEAVMNGGNNPSVSLSLRHGPDVSTAGRAVTTTPIAISSTNGGTTNGTVVNDFQSPYVPMDHWLWLEVSAVSGAPAGLVVSLILH